NDLARVKSERPDAVVAPDCVEPYGEQDVGGLGLAVGQPFVVAGAKVRVVPADVGQGMSSGAVDDDARTARGDQEWIELSGESEVSEVVGGELALPAGADAPLGGGHDAGDSHEQVEPGEEVADPGGGGAHAVEVGQVHGDDLAALHIEERGAGDVGSAGRND